MVHFNFFFLKNVTVTPYKGVITHSFYLLIYICILILILVFCTACMQNCSLTAKKSLDGCYTAPVHGTLTISLCNIYTYTTIVHYGSWLITHYWVSCISTYRYTGNNVILISKLHCHYNLYTSSLLIMLH